MDLQEFKNGVVELPRWLGYATIIFPLLGFGIGFVTWGRVQNVELLLSTLAGAQATVLAIVFAVTVLGIQLIAQQYSPRMIRLITKAPIFRFTFLVFVVSVGFDLVLLANVPTVPDRIFTGLIYVAAGMGVVAIISLYAFIQTAIDRLTPEGVVDAFLHDLPPEEYYNRVQTTVEDETRKAHPLHPLYTMIMNALSNRERVTVETALDRYGEHAEDTLEHFIEEDRFSESTQVSRQLFKPVLEEHLHDIALHAEEQNESQIVGSATEWIHQIGKAGLECADPTVSRQAVWGLKDVIIHAPIAAGNYYASDSGWRRLGELLTDAAEYPRPEVVWVAASAIKDRGPQMVWRAHDGRRLRHSMTDLYRKMVIAHSNLLDHYEEAVAGVEMDWQYDHVPDDTPNREQVSAVYRLRDAFFRTTGAFLSYLAEEQEYPITEGNFHDAWESICTEASESSARDYAVVLCQALIEAAYVVGCERPDDEFWWVDAIARVKYNGDPEIVDAAFNRIQSYDAQQEDPGIWTVDEREERRETYYQNLLPLQEYRPLNTHAEFPERVEKLRGEVEERWKQLEES